MQHGFGTVQIFQAANCRFCPSGYYAHIWYVIQDVLCRERNRQVSWFGYAGEEDNLRVAINVYNHTAIV